MLVFLLVLNPWGGEGSGPPPPDLYTPGSLMVFSSGGRPKCEKLIPPGPGGETSANFTKFEFFSKIVKFGIFDFKFEILAKF